MEQDHLKNLYRGELRWYTRKIDILSDLQLDYSYHPIIPIVKKQSSALRLMMMLHYSKTTPANTH
jgi:hypothetical protein